MATVSWWRRPPRQMPEFGRQSSIRQILESCPDGRRLLFAHGYDVGEGFVDVLSQYQSLLEAHRGGRLRDFEGLVRELNDICRPEVAAGGTGEG
jgi:hypothetical protein